MNQATFLVRSEGEWGEVISKVRTLLEGSARQEIVLSGPLGSGKTTFVRELLKSYGRESLVSSPSYVLEQRYSVPELTVPIAHWDIFRLKGGLPEELVDPPEAEHRIIEWGELSETLIARATRIISIEIVSEHMRQIRWTEQQR